MKPAIDQILTQQQVIAEMLGFFDPPVCREGISEQVLTELEITLQKKGFVVPESYKAFLKLHDGIANFSCSYDLFGSYEFFKETYFDELSNIFSTGTGFDYDPDMPPLMIGSSKETNTKVFFEYRHERNIEDEPVVLEGEPGFYTLHLSFYEFLECRIKANEKTIQTLSEYRTNYK